MTLGGLALAVGILVDDATVTIENIERFLEQGNPLREAIIEGAAQICLIGSPNSGKSSLHAILTGSKSEIGPFPYTTKEPLPGMRRAVVD